MRSLCSAIATVPSTAPVLLPLPLLVGVSALPVGALVRLAGVPALPADTLFLLAKALKILRV